MSAQVFFNLRRSCRWIEGNRNPSCQKYAKKTKKILPAGGQHEGNRLARFNTLVLQAGSHRFCSLPERAKGDILLDITFTIQSNMKVLRVSSGMPVKHIHQGMGS